KKFAKNWEIPKEFGFEEHEVTENVLLELKTDELYKAGLPLLVAKKFETSIKDLIELMTFCIQVYYDEGVKFEKYTMYNDDEFHDFLKTIKVKRLESIDDNSKTTKLPGQKVEDQDQAIEQKTLLA
ncbi:15900_t:CDS:2, partial [Dentiscutata erythropus]